MNSWQSATECLRRGDLPAARYHCERALADNPADPRIIHTLGLVSSCEGDLESAISLFREALRLEPIDPQRRCDLGIVYSAAGRWQEAAEAFAESVAADAGNLHCVLALARALFECRSFEAALEAYESARRLSPDSAEVFRGMGRSLSELGRLEESLQAFKQSAQLDPSSSLTFEYLADTHSQLMEHEQELSCSEHAARLNPESPSAIARLAVAYSNMGELDQSLAAFRNALQLDPGFTSARSSFLSVLLHHPAQSPLEILEEHKAWASAHDASREPSSDFENVLDPERRLRIGYMSAEFYFNPSAYFLAPILPNHDPKSFEIFLYHTRPKFDEWTDRFKAMTSNWREVHGQTDEEVASIVRKDRIDILIDVSGHYPYNRLRVFMLRAAPVQVAYLDYPATTGLAEMDFLLTDDWTDPPGLTEHHYTERLYRLASGYIAYQPPSHAPRVDVLPALKNGYLTFGLFQRAAKMNDRVWDAIAQVLLRAEGSHLLIHYVTRDFDASDSRMRRWIVRALVSRGIGEERLEFQGALGLYEHLACVARADISLDTFPYNGQTTTCESLWMGVPVVAMTGDSHVSRVGHAILHRVGLGDWVAGSLEEYAETAARVRLDALAELRAGMRERLSSSSLMDGCRVTRKIEQAYRWMWRAWCSSRECAGG